MTNSSGSTPTVSLAMTTIDCADPRALAAFWSALLGWEVAASEDAYAMVVPPGGTGAALGFGRVDGFVPATWPDHGGAKRFHLDLACTDIPAAEARAIELGAVVVDDQPGDTWRVLQDPAGHAFCLTAAANW